MSLLLPAVALVLGIAGLCVAALRVEEVLLGPAAGWRRPGIHRQLLLAAMVGGAAGAALALTGATFADRRLVGVAVLGALGCWMAAAAWLDWRTAWVPDSLVLGLAGLIAAYAVAHGTGPIPWLWHSACQAGIGCGWPPPLIAIAAAVALVGFLFALWGAQMLLRSVLMTPPDMLALVAPVVVFGTTLWALVAFATLSVLLAVARAVPGLRRAVDRHGAAAEAAAEIGFDPDAWGAPIPLYAVAMPSLAAAIAAAELWPRPIWMI